jgi:hypothetical protein
MILSLVALVYGAFHLAESKDKPEESSVCMFFVRFQSNLWISLRFSKIYLPEQFYCCRLRCVIIKKNYLM